MKLSYNWLKEYVKVKEKPEELAELLNLHVAEVEKVEKLGGALKNIIVGEILEIKPHPQADKLQIAVVVTKIKGKKKKLNIVCGAPNIKKGQKVSVALAGATLASAFDGLVIKKSKIRGVDSEGMLCAEDELGVGEDHTGIMILPASAKIGQDIQKALGLDDAVIEVSNTSLTHRPDLFSHIGIARELSALTGKKLQISNKSQNSKFPQGRTQRVGDKIQNLKIEVKDEEFCPRYMAVVMDGIKVGPSPEWLQKRLNAVGIRPISNVVDITNYVLAEVGQPLHAFDAKKLDGGKIIIRRAKKGEKMVALDGEERKLDEDMLVIADENKPIALAGVMGGANSEVDPNTKTIVIESANFDSVSIRRTSWKLGLRTEAAIRFEKGLPINFPEEGLFRAVDLIKKLAGGKVVSIVFDEISQKAKKDIEKRKKILLDSIRVNKFIGLDVSEDKMVDILKSLGFKTEELDLRSRLVKLAKKQLDKPYKFGASTYLEAPEIFDCSSLTRYLFRQIGIEIPRRSIEQFKFGQFKELDQLQIGDLIFSKSQRIKRGGKVFKGTGHVGIMVGKNQIIHASGKMGKVVQISLKNFLAQKTFIGVRQILPYNRGLVVTVPIFRPDVTCHEDLIEEIVRIFGFNKVIPRPIKGEMALTGLNKELLAERKIKNILVGLGFDEVYNYSFYSKDKLTEPDAKKKHLQLINPLNPDQEYLRTSLLPRLLDNAAKNARNFDQFRIFEVGRVYGKGKKGIEEKKMVAGVIYKKSKEKLFYLVKGAVEVLLDRMGIDVSKINPHTKTFGGGVNWQPLNNGNIGIWAGQELIGQIGQGFFELDLQKLIKLVEVQPRPFEMIPAYPPAVRDLGFVVDKSVTYKDLVKAIQKTDRLIKKVELFDIYQSDKLGKNKKNLAFCLTFQSADRTLKLKEVDQIQNKIVKKLEDKFGAKLRTF